MIKFKFRYVALYATGVCFLVFGNRDLWAKILEENSQKEANKKQAEEGALLSSRPFEVQELKFDPAAGTWANPHHYIQTVHVGRVNFKALRPKGGNSTVESNDDENASDTF